MSFKDFTSQDYQNLKRGNPHSIEKLYNLMSPHLRFFLKAYTKDNELISEIIQDVFVKVWQNRQSLTSLDSLQSYIYTIAKNHVIDILRRKKLKLLNLDKLYENRISSVSNPYQTVEQKELDAALKEGVTKLTARKKEIFILSRVDGLTYSQISERLNISISAVEKNISSALKELRKYISKKK